MSLTRKLLRELELNDDTIERIISAHVDTVDALRQERDAAQTRAEQAEAAQQERDELRTLCEARAQEAAAAREELAAFRAQVEDEKHSAARRTSLSDALTAQGANPQALPLLLDAIRLSEEAWDGDQLADASAALQPWRAKYAALFAAKKPLPVTRVRPPVNSGGLLTPADVKRMSASDINRNWSAVRTALQHN